MGLSDKNDIIVCVVVTRPLKIMLDSWCMANVKNIFSEKNRLNAYSSFFMGDKNPNEIQVLETTT